MHCQALGGLLVVCLMSSACASSSRDYGALVKPSPVRSPSAGIDGTEDASVSGPPRKCEIRLSVWCIYADNVTIQNKPDLSPAYHSIWKIWGSSWKDNPSVILEPAGCRIGVSDELQLISFEDKYLWNDRIWNSMVVRLKKDQSCDLRLLSPMIDEDPVGMAFMVNLTGIQACQTEACNGPAIDVAVGPEIQRQ